MIDAVAWSARFAGGGGAGPFDLHAGPGLHLVGGPSGCGKTTLLRAISGAVPAIQPARIEGTMTVDGRRPADIPPGERPATMGWMPQDPWTVLSTPWEEVALALEQMRLAPRETRARVAQALEDVGAAHLAHRAQSTLSGGEQARVLLAAAMAPRPRVLLLDEAMAQLDADGAHRLQEMLRGPLDAGTSVLATYHRREAWHLEHTAITLAPQPADEPGAIRQDPGDTVALLDAAAPVGRPVGPAELALGAGEALALTGRNGSGKSSILWLLAGLVAAREGSARVEGEEPHGWSSVQRARRIGFAFQDPAWHITQDTVWQEASFTLRRLGRDERAAGAWLHRFRLDHVAHRHPWDLSGGQRQRLAVVTALAHTPGLALLDEPTRGMDVAARRTLLDVIQERCDAGLATLVATHDASLIRAIGRRLEVRP